jgi:hypothetical protein
VRTFDLIAFNENTDKGVCKMKNYVRTRVALIGFLAGFAHVYSVQAGFDWVPPAELSSAPSDNYRNSDVLPFPDDASSVPVLKSAPEDQKGYESHPVSAPQIEWGPSDQQDAVSAAPSIKNGGSETRAVPGAYPPPLAQPASPLVGTKAVDPAFVASGVSRRTSSPGSPYVRMDQGQKVAEKTIEYGQIEAELSIVQGFGDQIPFSFAMNQIVPADFTVHYLDQPDPDTIVSWAGGRAWNKVLEDMLYAHGFRVRIQDKNVVIFKVGRTDIRLPSGLDQTTPPSTSLNSSMSEAIVPGAVRVAPSSTPYAERYNSERQNIYAARMSETVKGTLQKWASQSRVTLVYMGDSSLVLPSPLSYNATFTDAVEQLLIVCSQVPGYPRLVAELQTENGVPVLVVQPAREPTMVVK